MHARIPGLETRNLALSGSARYKNPSIVASDDAISLDRQFMEANRLTTTSPISLLDCGFCPVMMRPSVTT